MVQVDLPYVKLILLSPQTSDSKSGGQDPLEGHETLMEGLQNALQNQNYVRLHILTRVKTMLTEHF